ncbi:MAG: SpoIIE family protein phosphatase [Bacteroidia bacterium]
MNTRVKILFFWFLLLCTKSIFSQKLLSVADTFGVVLKYDTLSIPSKIKFGVPVNVENANYSVKKFDITTGLFSDRLDDIRLDQYNRLWFSSFTSGVGMIDGDYSYRYSIKQGIGDRIKMIHVGSDNSVWIATNGYGLYQMKDRLVRHFPYLKVPDVHINDITESIDKSIVVSTTFGGIYIIRNDSMWVLGKNIGLENKPIKSAVMDSEGNVWFTSANDFVGKISVKNKKVVLTDVTNLFENGKNCILKIDKLNRLIVCNSTGVYRFKEFNDASPDKLSFIKSNNISYIEHDDNDEDAYWFCSNKRLFKYSNNEISEYDLSYFEEKENINKVISCNSQLWILTSKSVYLLHDLRFYKPDFLKNFNWFAIYQKDLTHNLVLAKNDSASVGFIVDQKKIKFLPFGSDRVSNFEWDKKDRIWYCNETKKQVGYLDNNEFVLVLKLKKDEEIREIESIGDSIWILTSKKPYLISSNLKISQPIAVEDIRKIGRAKCGTTMYLATNRGFYKWNKGNTNSMFIGSLEGLYATNMATAKNNQLFIGTWGNYFYRCECDTFYNVGNNCYTHIVRVLHKDVFGDLWGLGQGTGLSHFNGKRWVGLSDLKGLIENDCFSIGVDFKHRVWIGTNDGFYRLTPKKKNIEIDSINGVINNYSIQHYNYNTGFPGGNGGYQENSIVSGPNGQIWINTKKGLFVYDEKADVTYKHKPSVFIKNVYSNRQEADWFLYHDSISKIDVNLVGPYLIPEELELPYSQNNVSFIFGGISWYRNDDLQFTYYLKGLEEDFHELNHERQAYYSNLSSGTYTFYVKAVNADGVESDQLNIVITILKPFWETIWFRVMAFIVVIIIIWLVFKWRNMALIAKKQELEEEVQLRTAEVVSQKEELVVKNKEIIDSINYAKRIQYALLAHGEYLSDNIPLHFIYFKPKDIVSGDFYWAIKKDKYFFLAVCDSTGHGVPGAFMSLLSISFLNEAINERNIIEPNEVFNYVRNRLIENISKEGQKDGFDGILLRIENNSNEICYAAANNAPVLIKESKGAKELQVLAKDRIPVGMSEKNIAFTNFKYEIDPDDILYLYTDGYADQFGGPNGKKLKYKNLNETIFNNSQLSFEEQRENLSKAFEEWKGRLEQIDDVCLVGLKIKN